MKLKIIFALMFVQLAAFAQISNLQYINPGVPGVSPGDTLYAQALKLNQNFYLISNNWNSITSPPSGGGGSSTNAYMGATNFTFSVSNSLYFQISNVFQYAQDISNYFNSVISGSTGSVSAAYVTLRTQEVMLHMSNATNTISTNLVRQINVTSNALYYALSASNVWHFNTSTWNQVTFSNVFWNQPNNSTIIMEAGIYPTRVAVPPVQTYAGIALERASFKVGSKTNISLVSVGGQARFLITNTMGASQIGGAGDLFWLSECDRVYVANIGFEHQYKPTNWTAFAVDFNIEMCRNVEMFRCFFSKGHDHGFAEANRNPVWGQLASNIVVRDCYFEHYGQTNWLGVNPSYDGTAVTVAGSLLVSGCTFSNCMRGIELWNESDEGLLEDIRITDNMFINCYDFAVESPAPMRGNHVIIANNNFEVTPDAGTSTDFNYLGVSINGDFSDYIIANNTFKRLRYGVYTPTRGWDGLTVIGNSFLTNAYGLFMNNYLAGTTNSRILQIQNNRFVKNTYAISVADVPGSIISGNLIWDCNGVLAGNQSPIHIFVDTNGLNGPMMINNNLITGERTNIVGTVAGISIEAGCSNVFVMGNVISPPFYEYQDSGQSNLVVKMSDWPRVVSLQPLTLTSTNNLLTNNLFVIRNNQNSFQVKSNGALWLFPDTTGNNNLFVNELLRLTSRNATHGGEAMGIGFRGAADVNGATFELGRLAMGYKSAFHGSNFFQVALNDINNVLQPNMGLTMLGEYRSSFGTNWGPGVLNVWGAFPSRPTFQVMAGPSQTTNALEVANNARAINWAVQPNGNQIIDTTNNVQIMHGAVDPSGAVTAGRGSVYIFTPTTNLIGGATYLWINTNGASGWFPKTL